MAFDKSGRRLVTGGRDGLVKMWNFNNGAILKKMMKGNKLEITEVLYVDMFTGRYIISVGWDRCVTIYNDDPDESEADPIRVLGGHTAGAGRE